MIVAAAPTTPAATTTSGGDWFLPWMVIGIVTWAVYQFVSSARRKRWMSIWEFWAPLLSVIKGDLHALFIRPIETRVTALRFRRQLDSGFPE